MEKCEIKIGTAGEFLEALRASAKNASKNALGIQASRETLKIILGRMSSVQGEVMAAAKSGELPADAKPHVEHYLGRVLGVMQESFNALHRESIAAAGFAEGMEQAVRVVEYVREKEVRKQKAIVRKLTDALPDSHSDAEDDTTAAPEEAAPEVSSEVPPAATDGSEVDQAKKVPEVAETAEECSHCKEQKAHPPSSLCVPCIGYKNRYGRLPTSKVLARRKAKGPSDSS